MSWHIETLVEDSSGGIIVAGILEALLEDRPAPWNYSIRRHRGVGSLPRDWNNRPSRRDSSLLQLLPARLRAYARGYDPATHDLVLIVQDVDNHDVDQVFGQLATLRRVMAGDVPVIIGIAVEEMEAWLLGDHEALLAAYPEADREILQSYRQDSICGTWEVLARVIMGEKRAERLIKSGYPAAGEYKHNWALKIAPHLDPDRNRSPSLQSFVTYLRGALDLQEANDAAAVH